MIKLFLATACAIIGVATAFQHQACIGAPNPGHVFSPSPRSCSEYVLCFNGETHLDECPLGRHFNARDQNCGLIGSVDCTSCGPIGTVRRPHQYNCAQFIECVFGTRTVRTCDPGTLFDSRHGACNLAHLVNCEGANPNPPHQTPPPPTPPGPIATHPTQFPPTLPNCYPGSPMHHPHPWDCTRFFMCVRGIRWEHVCPSGGHWNRYTNTCDRPENARCFVQPPPTQWPGQPTAAPPTGWPVLPVKVAA